MSVLACMCWSPHVSSDRNLVAVNGPKAKAVLNRENPRARLAAVLPSSLSPLI